MKRWLSFILLACFVATGLSACHSDPKAELPDLTVGGIIPAKTGALSWTISQGLRGSMTQETGAVFPLDFPDDYPELPVTEDGTISLSWDSSPDRYSVEYWKEEVWSDGMNAITTEAQNNEHGFLIPPEDTPAIVTVRADWDKHLFQKQYGSIEYIFKVIPVS